jgi:hypothetical protein
MSSVPSTPERGNFDRQRENMSAENRSLLQSAIWNSANKGNISADASPRKPDSPLISVPRISSEEWFHLFETTGLCQVIILPGPLTLEYRNFEQAFSIDNTLFETRRIECLQILREAYPEMCACSSEALSLMR